MSDFSMLFGAAQTNYPLVQVHPNDRISITRFAVTVDNANTADVGCVVGFGRASITREWHGHPGLAAGSGFSDVYPEGIVEGGAGDHLLFSCETPTGGSIRVSGSYLLRKF